MLAAGGAWHHGYWRLYRADEIGRMVDEESRPVVRRSDRDHVAALGSRAAARSRCGPFPQGEQSELLVWITAVRDGRTLRPASGWADAGRGRLARTRAGGRPPANHGPRQPAARAAQSGRVRFRRLIERSRRVGCRLFAEFPESVERLTRGSHWSPRRWLADVRSGGSAILRRYIAPERATLASAVLLGAREQLDPDRNEGYLVTGTIHVLSISGLHVGILAAGFFLVLHTAWCRGESRSLRRSCSRSAYALLTDLQPPVVRARFW